MNIRKLFPVIVAYFILVNIAFIILDLNVPKNLLFRFIAIFLLITFIGFFILFSLNIKKIMKFFDDINIKTWILLFLILFLGFSLRFFVATKAHRVLFDEDIYLNIAQNIKNELNACLCDYGTTEECYQCIPNKQPHAYSAFISIFFFFFGASEPLAHAVTILIGTLSVLLVFLVSYLLFKKTSIAIYSSLIFSLIPEHIRWSATTSLGPFFVFFTLMTVFLFLIYFRTKDYTIFLTAIFALAIALQGRPEANLVGLLVGSLFLLFKKDLKKEIISYKFIAAILLLLILVAPNIIHMREASSDPWGSTGKKIGLEYLEKNVKDNTSFFFENTRFPVIFTFLSILGLIYSLKNNKKNLLFLLTWFFMFFGIYAIFYAGSFNYGTDVRFSLNLYPSLALLAGLALFMIEKFLLRIKSNLSVQSIQVVFIILIILSLFPFVDHISTYGQKAWDARAAHDFASSMSEEIKDKNCYVFSHVSSMFLINGVNSLQTHLNTNKKIVDDIFKKSDCIFFYEGYWCVNVKSHREGICKNIKNNFDIELHDSYTIKDKTFKFYRLNKK